jgi:Fic family protein
MRTTSDTFGEEDRDNAVGLHALIRDFQFKVPLPHVRSEIVHGTRKTTIAGDCVLEQYPAAKGYQATGFEGNLRFALRYEPVDVGVYKALFLTVPKHDIEQWVKREPLGIFARRAWYLYELLIGDTLDVKDVGSGRYVDLLNEEIHIVGPRRLVQRQRVNDNMLGTKEFCPFIRRTPALERFFQKQLRVRAREIVEGVDPAILHRAAAYLYTKETKSSFAIEGEKPTRDRTERFIAVLSRAGTFNAIDKRALVKLQNAIVDPRYAQKGWRNEQNYVGETLHDYSQQVHFACPRPEDVDSLMRGWMQMLARLVEGGNNGMDEIGSAAASAFGFIFIHPFQDGNGRIHRFVVHHVLAKTGFTPAGIIFPISAVMLKDRIHYDQALEAFSKAIMPFVKFSIDKDSRMTVHNDTADLYRYFDATPQTEYLYSCIEETLNKDFKAELRFVQFFDSAMEKTKEIVDMPTNKASLLVRLIRQNNGTLSKSKRGQFSELADEEIERIEDVVKEAWDEFDGNGETEGSAKPNPP